MDFQTPPQSIVCFEQGGKGHVINYRITIYNSNYKRTKYNDKT